MKIHNIEQGTEEWHQLRCGIPTASEVKKLLTATFKVADNATSRGYALELAGQRITGRVEDTFLGYDMMRGKEEEERAFTLYCENYHKAEKVGFITTDNGKLGYSPDGVIFSEKGLIETKSAKQRIQVERILEKLIPDEFVCQIQTGLLVTEFDWLDFISFSNGMPMLKLRAYPNIPIQNNINEALDILEDRIERYIQVYQENCKGMPVADYIEFMSDDIQLD
jgi:hypothetical protein